MTEREDTIKTLERVLGLTHKNSLTVTIPRLTAKRAVSLLKEQPEIVRCKNCKHGKPVEAVFDDRYECHLLGSYISSDFALPPDWFCGDGEARQDE